MSEDLPFNRTLNLAPGVVDHVAPGVRRILADNPGPFTFKGTLSYIVGHGRVAIVDPGPIDARHTAALLDAVRGETVTHIIITHTHRDHSPGAAPLKEATGAPTFGEGPHRASRPLFIGETERLDAGGDTGFVPDHRLADGDVIAGDGWAIEAIATPGHTANHMAFALKGTEVLFSGDHVMGWSTSIVARQTVRCRIIWPRSIGSPGGRRRFTFPATATSSATRQPSLPAISRTAAAARRQFCIALAKAKATSLVWCGRFISGSIRGLRAPLLCRRWRIWKI